VMRAMLSVAFVDTRCARGRGATSISSDYIVGRAALRRRSMHRSRERAVVHATWPIRRTETSHRPACDEGARVREQPLCVCDRCPRGTHCGLAQPGQIKVEKIHRLRIPKPQPAYGRHTRVNDQRADAIDSPSVPTKESTAFERPFESATE